MKKNVGLVDTFESTRKKSSVPGATPLAEVARPPRMRASTPPARYQKAAAEPRSMLRLEKLIPEVLSMIVAALSNVTENEPVTGSTGGATPLKGSTKLVAEKS